MDPEQGRGGEGGGSGAMSPVGMLRRRRPTVRRASAPSQPLRANNSNAANSSSSQLLESLEKALAANLGFQGAVLAELARMNERKARNRALVVALRRALSQRRRTRREKNRSMSNRHVQLGSHATRVDDCSSAPTAAPFFSDSNGEDVPEPNPDAARRSSLEMSTILASRHPPWSSQESKTLKHIIVNHQQHNPNQPINYEDAAVQLATPSISSGKKSNKDKQEDELPTSPPVLLRTSRECELHHRFSLQRPTPWTKEESLKLAELANGRQSSWPDVVADLNEHSGKSRTVWECYVHYHTKIQPPTVQWSLPQDQLLLRYVAATGPQCVWNSPNCDAATRLSTTLLEDKSRLQILHRVHHSLCNPKLSNDPWTADEERKLVVCLKIYHDSFAAAGGTTAASNNDHEPQSASSGGSKALNVIAEHHLSHRSTKAVCDKWKKSLDPGHSSLPFTEQEDARLVEIASSRPDVGWADLCRQYFPSRHPERVAKRWAEVATNQQILDRERMVPTSGGGASAAGEAFQRGRRIPRSRAAPPPDTNEDEGNNQDDSRTSEISHPRSKRARLI